MIEGGPCHGDASNPIESAAAALPGSAASEMEEPALRLSRRLAARDSTPMLTKAMARKARLQGGGVVLASARDKPRVARLQKKSKLCGVTLDRDEANSQP